MFLEILTDRAYRHLFSGALRYDHRSHNVFATLFGNALNHLYGVCSGVRPQISMRLFHHN